MFQEIGTREPRTFDEWGIADGIFIDSKLATWGPPLSLEKLKRMIAKRVQRL